MAKKIKRSCMVMEPVCTHCRFWEKCSDSSCRMENEKLLPVLSCDAFQEVKK